MVFFILKSHCHISYFIYFYGTPVKLSHISTLQKNKTKQKQLRKKAK